MNRFVVSDPEGTAGDQQSLDGSGLGVWNWDVQRDEVRCDNRIADLHNVDRDRFDGRMDRFLARVHPDDRAGLDAVMGSAVATSEPFETEYRVLRPDGSVTWIDGRGRAVVDRHGRTERLIGVGLDTTELRAARERAGADDERRQLGTTVQAALRRAQQLQAIVTALSEAMTLDEVADVVLAQTKELLGALFAGLVVYGEDRRSLRLLRLDQLPDGLAERWVEAVQSAPSPLSDAVAGRRPVFHSSRQLHAASYPHLAGVTDGFAAQASASLPLVAAGRVIGALALAWADEQAFDPEDRAFLVTLARQCGEAIQRAVLFEEQHRVATILQRSILPEELPDVDNLRFAARYLPSEEGIEVGGDWYDVFRGPTGGVWLSVGDVGGHGVLAASVMSQLRNGVRACAFAGLDPSGCLGVLDRLLVESAADLYATAVVMVYDSHSGAVRWSNAGHPPPIVARPGRGANLLDAVHGSLLGMSAETPYAESVTEFPAGGLLVLYTDGLIERRGHDIQDALTYLVSAVGNMPLHRGVETLCDRVLAAAFADHNRQDDLCLLLAKRVADSASPPRF
jgi:hypothetical protein